MTFSDKTIAILNEPLTVYQRQASAGKSYPYVKGEDVIKQLNKAFGHAWSSKVLRQEEAHDQILVSVELSVIHDGHVVSHHGYGSAAIARANTTNKVIDIGNCYKSAFTTALKKAAEAFGIGLGGDEAPAQKPAQSYVRREAQTPNRVPYTPPAKPVEKPAPVQQKPAPAASALVQGNKTITEIQKKALTNLSKMKGIEEAELVSKALEGSGKKSFQELTELEAISVIKYANTTSKGR